MSANRRIDFNRARIPKGTPTVGRARTIEIAGKTRQIATVRVRAKTGDPFPVKSTVTFSIGGANPDLSLTGDWGTGRTNAGDDDARRCAEGGNLSTSATAALSPSGPVATV